MKISFRILLAILLTTGTGFYFMVVWIVDDLKPQYRELTEDPLVDSARILAQLAAVASQDQEVNSGFFRQALHDLSAQKISVPIYNFLKTEVDTRVYITDATGVVIYDSAGGRDEGKDYSKWNDVYLTLQGKYGSRTSRDIPNRPEISVMYVAAPIMAADRLIGVLTVGKPTSTVNMFVDRTKQKIIKGGIITFIIVVLVALLLSAMITRPMKRLAAYAKSVSLGERASLPDLGGGEIRLLGEAFEEMRIALEGKKYVEKYVQNLTHEMKSPLAGIKGAAELLREEMPAERRVQFLDNIHCDTVRLQEVIEKMLLLSCLENRRELLEVREINLYEIVNKIIVNLQPLWVKKGVSPEISGDNPAPFTGESFLVDHALVNIIHNALDFSPQHGIVRLLIRQLPGGVELRVEDQGPGVPEYALNRVFERFYSLKRPDTGKKSSGLGLSLVHEVMHLHHGTVKLENLDNSGARTTLFFPT